MIFKNIHIDDILKAANVAELFDAYADESKSDIMPEYNISHEMYNKLNSLGVLACFGCYDNDRLIGFMITITTHVPKYKGLITSIDSFFVLKEYRGGGTAKKLMDMVKEHAHNSGATNILMTAPVGSVLDRISSSIGFTHTHNIFIGGLDIGK